MDDPFLSFVNSFAALTHSALPSDVYAAEARPVRAEAPVALVFSPHPDDECLTGGLALRLRLEEGWRVINVPVTFGRNEARQAARRVELMKACSVLGFDLLSDEMAAFGVVSQEMRSQSVAEWKEKVEAAAAIIEWANPRALFFPHVGDAHDTHIGTHFLVHEALALMRTDFQCALVQTEYWRPNKNPNLMVELSADYVAILVKALMCHAGEIARNPYHLRFPAYLIDNVRRGSELVGGAGAAAVPFDFSLLYRLDRWENSGVKELTTNEVVKAETSVSPLLAG